MAKIRDLRLTSPHMVGKDVKSFQRTLNERLEELGARTIIVDGDYGIATARAYRQVANLLALDQATIDQGATASARVLIRHPERRTDAQKATSKVRIERFKKLQAQSRRGAGAMVAWARKQVGTPEAPAGSNRGPKVSRWQREFGIDGAPWCGAFVGYGLRKAANVPVGKFVVYTPAIRANALAGTGGFVGLYRWSEVKRGDLVLYNFPGGEGVDHVELYVGNGVTIGGNTSSGNAGSQNNGGGVYYRKRGGGQVVGCARPAYT